MSVPSRLLLALYLHIIFRTMELEKQLRQIWANVLSLEPDEFDVEDNLFECKTPRSQRATHVHV